MGILPETTAHFMRNKNLDNIQTDASRIVTGTTKFIPVQTLYDEIKWGTLESSRNKHKLVLFYITFNHISPAYLSFLFLLLSVVSQPTTYAMQKTSRL